MTNHTPGPWLFEKRAVGGYRVLGPSENTPVGIAPRNERSPEETKANARLIAAAPDLLAAAKEHVAGCRRCDGTGRTVDENAILGVRKPQDANYTMDCPDCADLRAAIAKAEGLKPFSKRTILDQVVVPLNEYRTRVYTLYHATAGLEIAGSGTRECVEHWGVCFQMDGAEHGQRYWAEEPAREHFNRYATGL